MITIWNTISIVLTLLASLLLKTVGKSLNKLWGDSYTRMMRLQLLQSSRDGKIPLKKKLMSGYYWCLRELMMGSICKAKWQDRSWQFLEKCSVRVREFSLFGHFGTRERPREYGKTSLIVPNHQGARRLSDRFGPMTVFCYSYQMMSPKFSRNRDDFFTAIFIYCINCRIVGVVVLLKSKRDGFWTNGQFAPISAYILIIPQFLYRQVIFYPK